MPPPRPANVPADAVYNPDENEWELGDRNASGDPVGPWMWWHPTGEKACEATYDDQGRLHGLLTRWHPNGERSQWAPWICGKTHGVQVWTRPTSGDNDPTSVLPPNVPDRVVRMDMPYEHGKAQPDVFTLYLEAGRNEGVPVDEEGRSINLASHLHKVDEDTILLPVEPLFTCLDGTEVEASELGRWIFKGPVEGGFGVRHRLGSDKVDHALSPQEISRAFTLAADGFLAWRERSRPEGVPAEARRDARGDSWSHGPEHEGRPHGQWTTWRPDGSVRLRQAYVHGTLEGPFERFHPDGTVACAGTHTAGRESGIIVWHRSPAPTDQSFPAKAPAIQRAVVHHDTDRTEWFLADDQPCNRHGIAIPEAWHDDWFAGDPATFLDDGFVSYLDAFCPKASDGPRTELVEQLTHLWGHPPARDVVDVMMHCIERQRPRLVEWRFGIDVLAKTTEGEVNTFELLLHAAQGNYLSCDLIELFGGCVWLGSLGNGDGWLVSLFEHHADPETPGQVYLFDHERVWISPAVAPSLSHLAMLTSLQDAWHDTESISPDALRAGVHRLDGLVAPPWHFSGLFEEVELDLTAYDPANEATRYLATISAWIIALLRNDGIADVEDDFIEDMFPAIDDRPWDERVAGTAKNVPVGLYWLWRLFFFGDDARLADVMQACERSPARLLRDAARLLQRIVEGEKQVGSIEDIHALRDTFQALDLDPARADAREAAAEAARLAAEQHRAEVSAAAADLTDDQLLIEAWAHVHDADWIAAAVARWQASGNPAWACLQALQGGLRLDSHEAWGLTERLRELDDPTVAVVATSWMRTGHQAHIARHLVRALAPAEALDPLLPMLEQEDTYKHDHTVVVELIGQRRRVDQVPVLVAALELDVEGLERIRNQGCVAGAIRALGRIGTPEAVAALRGALGRHDVSVLATALAEAGATEAVPELATQFEEHAPPELLWALAELASEAPDEVREGIAATASALEDRSLATMTVRGHLLRELGHEVDDLRRWVRTSLAPEAVRYSEEPSVAQKVWALRVAARHDDIEDEVISAWLFEENHAIREAARAAMAHRGATLPAVRMMDPVTVAELCDDELLAAVVDPTTVFRHLAIDRLGKGGHEGAGELLLMVLEDHASRWQPLWSGQDTPKLFRSLFRALRALGAPELAAACVFCMKDGRKQLIDPVLREPAPQDPELLPFMVQAAREETGWKQRGATAWLEAHDPEAVAAAQRA